MSPMTVDDLEMRAELLTRLGLPANAGPGHIEAAYRSAVSLLERLPVEHQDWADGQRAELAAIRSLLLDSTPIASTPIASTPAAAVRAPSTAPSTAHSTALSTAPSTAPSIAPSIAHSAVPLAEAQTDTPVAAAAPKKSRGRLIAVGAVALVLIIGGAIGFNVMHAAAVPGITGTPTNTANPSASPTLDMAQVAALMQKITTNPKDTSSLLGLAGLYFQAGDYANSIHFGQEAVAVAPNNDTAWTALGAAQFNQGKNSDAKVSWQKAVALNPKNAEAHYDLGFYYLSGASPNLTMVRAEWGKVIAINPNSDIAKTVKTHLASLSSAAATPSPTTSGK
jgi:tetratricopeptide (TPR) repeat protein